MANLSANPLDKPMLSKLKTMSKSIEAMSKSIESSS